MTIIESGFEYRNRLRYEGSIDGALTDYQKKITVYKGEGEDSDGVVYLSNHCEDDFDDIRFTEDDGATLMDYYIESYVSGVSAVVVIEFAYFPASPDEIDFYIYYGKPAAASQSNGTNTFDFFDDCEVAPAGFSLDAGKIGNAIRHEPGGANWTWGTATTFGFVPSATQIIEFWIKRISNGDVIFVELADSEGYEGACTYFLHTDSHFKYYDTAERNTGVAYSLDTWYGFLFRLDDDSDTYDWKIFNEAGTELYSNTNIAYRAASNPDRIVTLMDTRDDTYGAYFDSIRVRKYTANEPVFVEWGGEEKVYEYYDASIFNWSGVIYPSNESAQTFMVGTVGDNERHLCTAVRLLLSKVGTGKTIYVGIYETDESGTPIKDSEHAVWFGMYDGDIPTHPDKEYIIIDSYPVGLSEILEADTQYAIVVWYPFGNADNKLWWWGDALGADSYTGGKRWYSTDGGSSWDHYDEEGTFLDLDFHICGIPLIIGSATGSGVGTATASGDVIILGFATGSGIGSATASGTILPWQLVQLLDDEDQWVDIPYENTYILETDDRPVIEFSFTVAGLERGGTVWNLLTLSRRARIYQVVDDVKYEVCGRIVERPKRLEAPLSDVFSVVCYDETHDATRITFVDSWPKEGITTWTEIIEDAWSEYGLEGITFDGVETNADEPSEISNPLESLFDFMEQVCARTGWRWRVEDGDLKFFDPLTNVSDTVITADDIKPESIMGEDFPEVANVVKVPAAIRVESFEDVQDTVAGKAQYVLQYPPRTGHGVVEEDFKPEIWYDEAPIDPADIIEDGKYGSDAAIIVFNIENRFVRFNIGNIPDGSFELKVIYDVDIPVLVVRESAESITLFGRIEHPIRMSPRPVQEVAVEIADAYLDLHALPVTGFEAELLEYDVKTATMQRVVLEDHDIDQLMPVTQVERLWSPSTGFTMRASFQRAPVSDDDFVVDIFRRLLRIEARESQDVERIERYANVQDTWSWSETVTFGWSDVNWIADDLQLKHQKSHFGDEGALLIYPS